MQLWKMVQLQSRPKPLLKQLAVAYCRCMLPALHRQVQTEQAVPDACRVVHRQQLQLRPVPMS